MKNRYFLNEKPVFQYLKFKQMIRIIFSRNYIFVKFQILMKTGIFKNNRYFFV